MRWAGLGYTHVCTVDIPRDAQTVIFPNKYRSDKIIILDTPVHFMNHEMWKDDDICKLIVHQNGSALKYVKHQTEDICKLAVKQLGTALQYVKNQTDEICKIAVQQNGYALQYVKTPTVEINELAVKQNTNSWICIPR
uniref:DUF4116 domain-containing protein n=1 Tax=viral metagenome TaxID=1070528 RepID=A0A6C0J513_9ZZZZ